MISSRPVFTAEVDETPITLETLIARICKDPAAPSWARTLFREGHIPANVDYATAVNSALSMILVQSAQAHPRTVLSSVAAAGAVALTYASAVVTVTDKVKMHVETEKDEDHVTLVSDHGYYVTEKRSKDVLRAHVSDAMGYQLTPLISARRHTPGEKSINFRPTHVKSLNMVDQYFDAPVPKLWTSNASDNSLSLYDLYKTNSNLMLYHAYCITKTAQIKEHVNVKIPLTIPDLVKGSQLLQDGSYTCSVPSLRLQEHTGCPVEASFYQVLERHRAMRGADKADKLTSGYYLGSMSRSLDATLWVAADIYEAMLLLNRTHIVFEEHISNLLCAILAMNTIHEHRIRVYVVGSNSGTTNPPYKRLGLHDVGAYPPDQETLYYSRVEMGVTIPTYLDATKSIRGVTKEEFGVLYKAFGTTQRTRMTHAYLRDYMSDYTKAILPSIHAHSGHCLLFNQDILDAPKTTVRALFVRATIANKYKSAFPVNRVTFSRVDDLRPTYVFTSKYPLLIPPGATTKTPDALCYTKADVDESRLKLERYLDVLVDADQVPMVKVTPPAISNHAVGPTTPSHTLNLADAADDEEEYDFYGNQSGGGGGDEGFEYEQAADPVLTLNGM